MTKVFAVRTGNKYGPEYEDYLRTKIPNIEFLNKDVYPYFKQWNKLSFMELDYEEPICVIDIDILLVNNYMELFNMEISRGEFLTLKPWWRDTYKPQYTINGGFYKFYPIDLKPVAEKWKSDPNKWKDFYWLNGTTYKGMGEQYFVEDSVKELGLSIKYAPQTWYTKWENDPSFEWIAQANAAYPGEWLYLDEFNPDIKLIHYQAEHYPHEAYSKDQ